MTSQYTHIRYNYIYCIIYSYLETCISFSNFRYFVLCCLHLTLWPIFPIPLSGWLALAISAPPPLHPGTQGRFFHGRWAASRTPRWTWRADSRCLFKKTGNGSRLSDRLCQGENCTWFGDAQWNLSYHSFLSCVDVGKCENCLSKIELFIYIYHIYIIYIYCKTIHLFHLR